MVRLNLNRAPVWLDLGGNVSVEVLPFGTEVELRSHDIHADLREELGSADLATKSLGLIKTFGRAAIVNWSGVDVEGRDTSGPWPEGIDALLAEHPYGRAFERLYVLPALLAAAEKNASAPSPNGTSVGVETTVPRAPVDATSAPIASTTH